MATMKKLASGRYRVRWRALEVSVREDGETIREWKYKERTVRTKKAAEALKRAVEDAAAQGKRWEDERERPIATLSLIGLEYVRAAVDAGRPISTQRFRSSMIGSFLEWAGENTPVSQLSRDFLRRYARTLPSEGRKAETRYRKVMEVEKMWAWAYEDEKRFPGVPKPRRLTGRDGELQRPPPVVATASPTWAEIDAMIGELNMDWHVRAALVLRYTGLRVSQVLGLQWRDVDVEQRTLLVRAGTTGAKKGAARVMPLHPDLAARMAKWERPARLVFPRVKTRGPAPKDPNKPYRGDVLDASFRRAWVAAEVPEDRWGRPQDALVGDRGHERPVHCIRAGVKTGLLRAGVEDALTDYLIGHGSSATHRAYVPLHDPVQSPYWPRLVQAMAKIPAFAGEGT